MIVSQYCDFKNLQIAIGLDVKTAAELEMFKLLQEYIVHAT